MIRLDQPDLIYKNEEVKFNEVVKDIAARHALGQPVLVGTTSVEKSEYLSKLLAKAGINIEMISTSEIRISVITSDDQVEDAARAVHTAFGLDSEIEAVVYAGTGR